MDDSQAHGNEPMMWLVGVKNRFSDLTKEEMSWD